MINNENEILKKIPDTLDKFKATTPLTQCITNFVTVNDCANAILAFGISNNGRRPPRSRRNC